MLEKLKTWNRAVRKNVSTTFWFIQLLHLKIITNSVLSQLWFSYKLDMCEAVIHVLMNNLDMVRVHLTWHQGDYSSKTLTWVSTYIPVRSAGCQPAWKQQDCNKSLNMNISQSRIRSIQKSHIQILPQWIPRPITRFTHSSNIGGKH